MGRSKATRTKTYVGKVTNYFVNIGVAEILVESGSFNVGDSIMISGPTTGVIEMDVPEIRVDLKSVESAVKGDLCLRFGIWRECLRMRKISVSL